MDTKVETINKMSSPTKLREVQVFHGTMGYYRQFIKDFTQLSEPLVFILNDAPFEWGPVKQETFEALKATLKEAPISVYPNLNKEFILYTDASNFDVGAILAQINENGQVYAVAYALQVMNRHKSNYSVTKKECLAVIFAVEKFRR